MTFEMAADESPVTLTEDRGRETDEPVSVRIARLVAVTSDREVSDLEPLGRVIDTDALEALFSPGVGGNIEGSFRYEGYRVEIDADGTVRLREAAEQPD